jgi:NAD(P)-dependent dehydrogenase (short-subunit alcohol dehydrogenase family)
MSTQENFSLAGKRAVVTGAGKGIGRSIALTLAQAGVDVGIVARTESDLAQLRDEIQALGRRAVAVTCDVTDVQQVQQMASTLQQELGDIDILVNNAGNAGSHKFLTHPDELWDRMLAINLTSVYYVTKAFLPPFVEKRDGRIINIASIASRKGGSYISAYTASKHGVLGLTRALAAELRPYNITVNAVCPGYVDTPMTDDSISNIVARTGMSEEKARESLERTSPLGRLITSDEVAAAVIFLALDINRSITGQAINIDGGGVMS